MYADIISTEQSSNQSEPALTERLKRTIKHGLTNISSSIRSDFISTIFWSTGFRSRFCGPVETYIHSIIRLSLWNMDWLTTWVTALFHC